MDMPLWFSNLFFWSLQVALLVLAAASFARALKLQQPRVLLAYWRSLLVVSFLLPLMQPWHRPPIIAATVIPAEFAAPFLPSSTPAPARWHLPGLQTLAPILGIVILGGITVRFALLGLGLLRLRRLRQTSQPIEASTESAAVLQAMSTLLSAPAEFRLSSQVDSPVTFGFMRPLVLLPERFTSLEPRFQSAIACHELLHVRRRDWAHHLVEEAGRALFWFHPAIAWVISRVRLAREQVVDLEVVRLTSARKSYLEALLEFTNARAGLAAIPAPPFLAERQLVERVSLMLKEVRMSQRRLIVSLALVSSCLALVIALAAWTFPLKGQGRSDGIVGGVIGGVPVGVTQGVSHGVVQGVVNGVAGGVSNGIAKGIAGGISSGISGGISTRPSSEEPSVDVSTIWTDTAKRGSMAWMISGDGSLVRGAGSTNLIARLTLPRSMAAEVKEGQKAVVTTEKDPLSTGRVSTVATACSDACAVDIALLDPLPQGTKAGLGVIVRIDLGRLDDILYIGRPVHSPPNSEISLFKISNNGKEAVRTRVKVGRAASSTIEVLDGLKEGDKVIISDMSAAANDERIRLTDEKHLTTH